MHIIHRLIVLSIHDRVSFNASLSKVVHGHRILMFISYNYQCMLTAQSWTMYICNLQFTLVLWLYCSNLALLQCVRPETHQVRCEYGQTNAWGGKFLILKENLVTLLHLVYSMTRGTLQIQDRLRPVASAVSVIGCATRPVVTSLAFATRARCIVVC